MGEKTFFDGKIRRGEGDLINPWEGDEPKIQKRFACRREKL
jgi:hypothetical protein